MSRRERFRALIPFGPSHPVQENDKAIDGQSIALDTAKTICQLASNLGSGALNVPGLQAAGSIGVQIIDIVKKMKANKADGEELATLITKLLDPLTKALESRTRKDIDPGLEEDINCFKRDLETVRDRLKALANRGVFGRGLNNVADSECILKCKDLINQAFVRFQVYTLIALRMDSTHPGRVEALDSETSHSIPPLHSQPVAPEIFFGRDDIVSSAASLVVSNEQTRLAFLGSGGIGKTSAALHIIHHTTVKDRYGIRRYFVGCDAITSADSLAKAILDVMQIPSSVNVIDHLHQALSTASPTLLLLDNFETPWDSGLGRAGIRDILQHIGSAKSISLIITMRGSKPPAVGMVWNRTYDLLALSLEAAKKVFAAIDPPTDNTHHDDEILNKILVELDCVPLAIQLFAQAGIGFSLQYMLRRWTKERTSMLRTYEANPDRLESVEVSISLSLAALGTSDNAEAVQLLGVLCHLPDGLHRWEERLTIMAPRIKNIHHSLSLLLKTSLVYTTHDQLKVLSPIRHFVNRCHPAAREHIECLEEYFWSYVDKMYQ